MKTTVHFVYRVEDRKDLLGRIFTKFLHEPNYRRYHQLIKWPLPVRAPLSITYNILMRLKQDFEVKLYDIGEQGDKIKLLPNDILLFHPSLNATNYTDLETWTIDKKSSSWIALKKYSSTNKIIVIVPYVHFANQFCVLQEYFELTQNMIAICGEYWLDTWDYSPYKNLLNEKPLQVNMGINADDYRKVKNMLNPKGKRKFLYIGNAMPWKNTVGLEKIAEKIDGFQGGYISTGEIKGWKKIASFANLTSEFMHEICKEYDFFLNMSFADAQATTVAEQMCFGMVVACTPESGYTYSSIINLHIDDTEFNCNQIQKMQEMDEDEYFLKADKNYKEVITSHSWNSIYHKIYQYIKNN